jgi:hypothetical protein
LRRVWIGIALLSSSWAFGITFYHQPVCGLFFIFIGAGLFFFSKIDFSLPPRFHSLCGAVLLLPAIFLLSWPYKIIPILFITGLIFHIIPVFLPHQWKARLSLKLSLLPSLELLLPLISKTLIFCSALLTVQAVVLELYAAFTAYFRELPRFAADILNGLAGLIGLESGVSTNGISIFTMRKIHTLGATWELILDPVLLAFITGCLFYFCYHLFMAFEAKEKLTGFLKKAGLFIISVCIWIPVRCCLLLAVFLHRALIVGYDEPLQLMNQFFNQWVFIALLLAPLVFMIFFVRLPEVTKKDSENKKVFTLLQRKNGIVLLLSILSTIFLCTGFFFDPVGARKKGRVYIDEYHTDWEPTERPFDTKWYGEKSTYNYACIYDYTSRYFDISRLEEKITEDVLSDCDVLILQVPQEKYEISEIRVLTDFVTNGGGLILIAEHTDIFRSSSHLNAVAMQFGFEFEDTSLIDIDKEFRQTFQLPQVPHPIIQHVPYLRFQVSCSLHPRTIGCRSVIRATGLRSLFADYHMGNFYPQVIDYSNVRYGAFIQLWAQRYGKGRIVAFTDSTMFSNFSAFEPGISELWCSMIEWCNHQNGYGESKLVFLITGFIILCMTIFLMVRYRYKEWIVTLSVILFTWTVCCSVIAGIHRITMPFPENKRPFVRVNIDRNLCDTTLGVGGFIEMSDDGFGIFELWVLRLGYFTKRCYGNDVFTGNLIMFFYPEKKVSGTFRKKLANYVEKGGKVLIIDSERNKSSTVNELIEPFGLAMNKQDVVEGFIGREDDGEGSAAVSSHIIDGGTPFVTINDKPIGVFKHYGKGSITVIGFGNLFNDDQMGIFYDVIPGDNLLRKFGLEFLLVRTIIENNRPALYDKK